MLTLRLVLSLLILVPALAAGQVLPAVNTPYYAGQVVGRLIGANMNVTTDQAIAITASKYIIRRIVVTNASTNLTLAVGGFYTATSKGGTAVVAATQVYTALTGSTKYVEVTLQNLATDVLTAGTIYLSLTVAQGGAATCDVYVYADALP